MKSKEEALQLVTFPEIANKCPIFGINCQIPIQLCIEDQSRVDPFVRSVTAAPQATCVLATNEQLNDLIRFCTNPDNFSILGIDPTFNLGEFAVTVTTFRHLMLENRETKEHPVMIGPMFAHQRKDSNTYYTFASALLGLKSELKNLQCIGTDGETAIASGFQLTFPSCKHILCFLHQRRNINFKLSELGITRPWANLYIKDIFGYQEGTHYISGLVDSSSENEFDKNLSSLKEVWNNRENEARDTLNSQFYKWFLRYHADNMKSKMIAPVRSSLGLGSGEFTTNANESANARIKTKVNYKANELNMFCLKMRELIDEQQKDIEKAFAMDCGPYQVTENYKHFMKQPSEWVKMGRIAREKHLHKISRVTSDDLVMSNSQPVAEISFSSDMDIENLKPISISLEQSGLSHQMFSSIWKKASQLISQKDMIVDAPGCDNVKVVASYSSSQPHFVRIFQTGKITCDCQNNSSLALCSHAVAVADSQNCLRDWYNKTKQSANLWTLSKSSKIPKKPGAKPHQKSSRRNKIKLPVQSRENFCPNQATGTIVSNESNESMANYCPPYLPSYQEYSFNPYVFPYYSYQPCTPMLGQSMSYYQYADPSQRSSSIEIQHNSHPFILLIRHGNISKCASCGESFTRDQQVLVVKHIEKSL